MRREESNEILFVLAVHTEEGLHDGEQFSHHCLPPPHTHLTLIYRLKALLQLMAASVANRDIVYFTFGDRQLQEDMFHLYTFLRENKLTVCNVWDALLRYYTEVIQGKGQRHPLYDFIVRHFTQSGRASQSSQSGRASQSSQSSGPGQDSVTVEYSLGV